MAEKKRVPKQCTITDVELEALLYKCAKYASDENNSTTDTLVELANRLAATVPTV